MKQKEITVTSPLMPPLEELQPYLEEIWKSRRITSEGVYHALLEKAIRDYLKVLYVSLFTNGTTALICALRVMDLTGEVITTPYSFVATTHALWLNGLKPVFADISSGGFNIDPGKIEQAVTSHTKALLPVHVYGTPCNIHAIKNIADACKLNVIYDAAHTFGVEFENRSLLNAGDLSVLSFNATKVYNTIEGGAIISHDRETKKRIDRIRSFGFVTDSEVAYPGTNGKLDEIRSAYGLAGLKYVKEAIASRRRIAEYYTRALQQVTGIRLLKYSENEKPNYSYFPIIIHAHEYGMTRDALYEKMKKNHISCRRYFYPLISSFPPYQDLPSAHPDNLPRANYVANSVLCLPIHHELQEKDAERIVSHITSI
jgi:dTDP-4-amino-4,6-dideoxygalactose transaminase